jgi:hypothetical protein
MTSTIGQAAFPQNPLNAQPWFPREPLNGSTSGIGGQSSQSFIRYPAEPTHNFRYTPGSKREYKQARYNIHEAKGTWGGSMIQKVNLIKQRSGSSGYLSQHPLHFLNKTQMTKAASGQASAQSLPRGGNILPVGGGRTMFNSSNFNQTPIDLAPSEAVEDAEPVNENESKRRAASIPGIDYNKLL